MFDEPAWDDAGSDGGSERGERGDSTTTTTTTATSTSNVIDVTPIVTTGIDTNCEEEEEEDSIPKTKKRKLCSDNEGAKTSKQSSSRCNASCCTCGDCNQMVNVFHALHLMFPGDKSAVLKALATTTNDIDEVDTAPLGKAIRAAFRVLTRFAVFEGLPEGTRFKFASKHRRRSSSSSNSSDALYDMEKNLAVNIGKALGVDIHEEKEKEEEEEKEDEEEATAVVGYVPCDSFRIFDRSRIPKSLLRSLASATITKASQTTPTRATLTKALVDAASRKDTESALSAMATAQMLNITMDNTIIKSPTAKIWPCSNGTEWCTFSELCLNDDTRSAAYLSSIPTSGHRVFYDGGDRYNTSSGPLARAFAARCGVARVTDLVQVDVTAPHQEECIAAELFLSRHSEALQRYIMFARPAAYQELTTVGSPASTLFSKRLSRLRVVRCTPYLHIQRSLRVSAQRSRQLTPPTPCAALLTGDTLYFWGAVPAPAVPVALFSEMSRVFSLDGSHVTGIAGLLTELASGNDSPDALSGVPQLPSMNVSPWRPCAKSCAPLKENNNNSNCVASVATLVAPVVPMDTTLALMGSARAEAKLPLYNVSVYTLRGGPKPFNPEGKLHKDENVAVGRLGEEVAYRFLLEQNAGSGAKVTWPNETVDGGLPYDLFVTYAGGEVQYYEVKATSSYVNISFPVTSMELDFAKKHRKNYHILRVLRVGKPDVTVVKLTNPFLLAMQRNVHLWFEIDTEKRDF